MTESATKWRFRGDVNLEYGGFWVKVDADDYRNGYLETVEVTDLDSASGATGMCLIEARTAIIDRQGKDRANIRRALKSQGANLSDVRKLFFRDRAAFMFEMARAAVGYGRCDPRQPDHMWDQTPPSMVVQTQAGGPMQCDGWKAEKFIDPKDLRGFVADLYDIH